MSVLEIVIVVAMGIGLAIYIGISIYKLYQLVKSSQIAFSKPNRKLFFNRHELDEWINKTKNI